LFLQYIREAEDANLSLTFTQWTCIVLFPVMWASYGRITQLIKMKIFTFTFENTVASSFCIILELSSYSSWT